MTRRSLIVTSILFIAVAAGVAGWYQYEERNEAAVPVEVAVVAAPSVVALGEILPLSDIVVIAAPSGQDVGRIAEIKVAEGASVRKGDVIAVLDTMSSRSAKRVQQEAVVKQREAALQKVRADLAASTAQLKATLAQQTAARDKLNDQIARKTFLSSQGVVDKAGLSDMRLDLAAAEALMGSTQVSLDRNAMKDASGMLIDEATATADLEAAKAQLLSVKDDEEKAYVRAPISGRILTLRGKIGEQIGNDGLADIGDVSTMQVRAEVYESDFENIAAGDKATVTSRSLDGEMTATVERVGARITKQSITSTDPAAIVDARVVVVWLRLDETASAKTENRSGLQVQVVFKPKGKSNA